MATVYWVWYRHPETGERMALRGTEEMIKRVGAERIDAPPEEVPEDLLDAEGRYNPNGYGRGPYGQGPYGGAGYGVAGGYGRPSIDERSSESEVAVRRAFQSVPDPAKVVSEVAPSGRLSMQGAGAHDEPAPVPSDTAVDVQGVQAIASTGPFVPDASQAVTEPPNEVRVEPAAPIVAHDVPAEVLAGGDAVQSNSAFRRSQQATVAAATSGPTEPLSPRPAGDAALLMPQEQPQAGTAPIFALDRDGEGFDEGQWAPASDTGQAGTAPREERVGETAPRASTSIGKAVLVNGDAISVAGATLILLIDERLAALRPLNNDAARAAFDELKTLRLRVEEFLNEAEQYRKSATDEQKLEAADTSLWKKFGAWWDAHPAEKNLALFGAGLVMCSFASPTSVLVVGSLVGGRTVAEVFKSAASMAANHKDDER